MPELDKDTYKRIFQELADMHLQGRPPIKSAVKILKKKLHADSYSVVSPELKYVVDRALRHTGPKCPDARQLATFYLEHVFKSCKRSGIKIDDYDRYSLQILLQ